MIDKYLVEVRVSDPDHDKDTMMGYFPPESLEALMKAMDMYPIHSEDDEYCSIGGCRFVVGEKRTYFDIWIDHPRDDK